MKDISGKRNLVLRTANFWWYVEQGREKTPHSFLLNLYHEQESLKAVFWRVALYSKYQLKSEWKDWFG